MNSLNIGEDAVDINDKAPAIGSGLFSSGRATSACGHRVTSLDGSRSVLGRIMHNNGVACNKILEIAYRPH
ncbi:Uncharacterised protein [Bordetella pertussis]|nr:Uncharacterised protein [Bordetella pertussis]CPI05392.1 Uncharacterised protein [Bordetella pertussis]CPK68842.1 Uncharacterised protein [Bordetella pertussis]